MSQMFRCPTCKEVIRIGVPTCQYCNSPVDGSVARIEAVKFQAGIDACAAANHIKNLNYAAPILLLIDAALPLFVSGDGLYSTPRLQIYSSLLPVGALAGVIGWFTKYGGLKTDDPDFPQAKQTVKKSLILWLILSAIHIVVLTKTF